MMRSTTLFAWFALSSFLSLGVAACQTDNGAPCPMLGDVVRMFVEQGYAGAVGEAALRG